MIRRTFTTAMRPGHAPIELTGYKFDVSGIAMVVHFVPKGNRGWHVSEPTTGHRVTRLNYASRTEAQAAVLESVKHPGRANRLREAISRALAAA